MTNTTKVLALVSLLVPACDGADATPRWNVVQRSQQGAFERFEVEADAETYTVVVHHGDSLSALVPTADAGVVETPAGRAYFDGSGALEVDEIDDPVAVELLDAAVAGELDCDQPTFRLDGRDFIEGGIGGAAWPGCLSSCQAAHGADTFDTFICLLGC